MHNIRKGVHDGELSGNNVDDLEHRVDDKLLYGHILAV